MQLAVTPFVILYIERDNLNVNLFKQVFEEHGLKVQQGLQNITKKCSVSIQCIQNRTWAPWYQMSLLHLKNTWTSICKNVAICIVLCIPLKGFRRLKMYLLFELPAGKLPISLWKLKFLVNTDSFCSKFIQYKLKLFKPNSYITFIWTSFIILLFWLRRGFSPYIGSGAC